MHFPEAYHSGELKNDVWIFSKKWCATVHPVAGHILRKYSNLKNPYYLDYPWLQRFGHMVPYGKSDPAFLNQSTKVISENPLQPSKTVQTIPNHPQTIRPIIPQIIPDNLWDTFSSYMI